MALKDLFGKKKAESKADEKEVKATKKVAKTEEKSSKTTAKKTSTKTKAEKVEAKDTEVKAVKAKKSDSAEATPAAGKSDYGYRITEKATRLADKNVYVLNVPKTINKTQLKTDLEKKYKVTVLGINIVNSAKKVFTKNTRGGVVSGQKGGGKKAYITLKAGDSIVL